MAVGGSEHPEAAAAAPALSQQLFPWVEAETPSPFLGRLPDVAAGPDPLHPQGGVVAFTQQQGAALLRFCRLECALQNHQAMPTELQALWR
jgi:hypothetical protein